MSTVLSKILNNMATGIVETVLTINRAMGDEDVQASLFIAESYNVLDLTPKDALQARRIVGKLIFALGFKPEVVKESWGGEESLRATFRYASFEIRVAKYRGANCRVVEKKVIVPAVPAKEAVPEHEETVREIVCDGPPLVSADVPVAAYEAGPGEITKEEEVPF